MMDSEPMHRFVTREEWRQWLHENHDKETGIWFVFPLKASGERTVSYNDAVEEALCYGWIDSTIRSYDEMHKIQRFTPRNPKSTYSQSNKERLRWLADRGMIHPDVLRNVARILNEEYIFPEDILEAVREDEKAWEHFQRSSEPYKRIRIAFIDSARENDEEFTKRLNNFMKWTRKGKLVPGYGGIDKYY